MNKNNHILMYVSITGGACIMYAVSAGLRSVYGIMLNTISSDTGIAYAAVSFAIAIGQLVFGIAQPVFGIVAIKKSNKFVLVLGSLFMAVGLIAIPFCKTEWMLLLFLGIILPIGTGAISFGMIMGAITPKLGEQKAASASGFVNASSGIGSIVFSPIIQSAFSIVGLTITMFGISIICLLLIPISVFVSGKNEASSNSAQGNGQILTMLKEAFRDKNFIFLMIGFFTCGFHMAMIETHLYSQILSYGISDKVAALSFSIYGIASIIGSLLSGFLCMKIPMKYVVGTLYGSRVIWVLLFLILPKSVLSVVIFCICLGLTGAATVTPTSGLVGKLFGSTNIPTLFGIVFVSHQVGSFLSAWLGGKCFEATGNYIIIWIIAAILSACAMVASYKIKER